MFWNNIFYPQTRISPVWNYEGVLRFACFQMPIQKNPQVYLNGTLIPIPWFKTTKSSQKQISWDVLIKTSGLQIAPFFVCFGIWSIPQSLHKTLAPFQTRYRSLVIYAKYMFSKLVGILRGWWWFPQSSLMFSKASQSSQTESLGLFNYHLPWNTPPTPPKNLHALYSNDSRNTCIVILIGFGRTLPRATILRGECRPHQKMPAIVVTPTPHSS